MTSTREPKRARLWFAMLCAAALTSSVAYIVWTGRPAADVDAATHPVTSTAPLSEVQANPYVAFRDTSLGATHGHLVFRSLDTPLVTVSDALKCERVDFANGQGVCLRAERGFSTSYDAVTFDSGLVPQHTIALPGVPSRVRLSPNGERAGITVFVSGDSYAPGTFSTRTTIIETKSGQTLGDLEQFTVFRDGSPFKAVDFNFWGLTFATEGNAYATLGTGGRTYLVGVDIEAREARILRENVECPALSPDGSRIAFKKRVDAAGRLVWRLHVLDLQTGVEHALAEERSVDDQAEWLDLGTVTYALPSDAKPGSTDVWSVPADGSGQPKRLLPEAWSPAFVGSRQSRPGERKSVP